MFVRLGGGLGDRLGGGLGGRRGGFCPAAKTAAPKAVKPTAIVATGKIEPITKVEIKSKANGIIERLHVDVGHVV